MSALIIDCETTGLVEPEVIELAGLELQAPTDLDVVDRYYSRFRPSKPITLGAMSVHGILDEELRDSEPWSGFEPPDRVEYLIGHNVDFDWQAIGAPAVKRIDTLSLCRKLWPEADCHSLAAMLYMHRRGDARERLAGAHGAMRDAENCLLLLRTIMRELPCIRPGPHTWESVWLQSEAARIPDRMPFGKHKGMPIAELPADYVRWLLRQELADPYLVKALALRKAGGS